MSLMLLLALGLLQAAQPQPRSYFPGTESCGKWISAHAERNGLDSLTQEVWVNGFLSAINLRATNRDVAKGVDREGISAFITKHCEAKPLDTIQDAARALLVELVMSQ